MRPLRIELGGANCGLLCANAKVGADAAAPASITAACQIECHGKPPSCMFWWKGSPRGRVCQPGEAPWMFTRSI